ncbi:unnamed protein product [Dibothriocephalus latus]|uniref:Uncharacterized protein n=1 Tax=Dibothriocephalus latus TaxID=60516 RepID=A0A3P7P389_DIBLA|nr:unnamed protein product [Dibothriocephalus latus]
MPRQETSGVVYRIWCSCGRHGKKHLGSSTGSGAVAVKATMSEKLADFSGRELPKNIWGRLQDLVQLRSKQLMSENWQTSQNANCRTRGSSEAKLC